MLDVDLDRHVAMLAEAASSTTASPQPTTRSAGVCLASLLMAASAPSTNSRLDLDVRCLDPTELLVDVGGQIETTVGLGDRWLPRPEPAAGRWRHANQPTAGRHRVLPRSATPSTATDLADLQ
jgi:hypothetical protein